jgi:hypothetical protein
VRVGDGGAGTQDLDEAFGAGGGGGEEEEAEPGGER